MEKIYSFSLLLGKYLNDISKLRNLMRIQNFDLIIGEIQKLNSYTENQLFFVSL